VQRAYMGVSIQDIDSKFAGEKNIKQLRGIYVNGISEGGSAQDAGITEGDVITKIQEIPVGSVSELQEQVSRYRPGDKISVTVTRRNNEMSIPVVLKTLDNTTRLVKKSEVTSRSMTALGAEFEEIDNSDLAKMRIENGVKISKLNSGKLSQVGIQAGFIITSIDKKKINSVEAVKNMLENKSGNVLIEGFYPNGMRASYSFSL